MSVNIASAYPNVADNTDLIRIGYLEECLRHIGHIGHIADKRRDPYVGLAQIRSLYERALEAGDPLTSPEARK